jgi:hypothetical protein
MLPARDPDTARMAELDRLLDHRSVQSDAAKQESLDRYAAQMRAHLTPSTKRPSVVEAPQREIIESLLRIAYARPCGVCEMDGACRHREPLVEIALLCSREVAW